MGITLTLALLMCLFPPSRVCTTIVPESSIPSPNLTSKAIFLCLAQVLLSFLSYWDFSAPTGSTGGATGTTGGSRFLQLKGREGWLNRTVQFFHPQPPSPYSLAKSTKNSHRPPPWTPDSATPFSDLIRGIRSPRSAPPWPPVCPRFVLFFPRIVGFLD